MGLRRLAAEYRAETTSGAADSEMGAMAPDLAGSETEATAPGLADWETEEWVLEMPQAEVLEKD